MYKRNLILETIVKEASIFIFLLIVKITFTIITTPDSNVSIDLPSPFGESRSDIFLYSILIIPLIETLFFQVMVFEIGLNLTKSKPALVFMILLSSVLFALFHFQSLELLIIKLVGGLFYALSYYYARQKLRVNALLFTFGIHSLHNLYGFLLY